MRAWKRPDSLRSRDVAQWRKNRFEKAMRDPNIMINDPDRAKVIKAANLYSAAVSRGDSLAMGLVSTFR
jgi:hypothetical protein